VRQQDDLRRALPGQHICPGLQGALSRVRPLVSAFGTKGVVNPYFATRLALKQEQGQQHDPVTVFVNAPVTCGQKSKG
jgi:hypothetical protein